VYRSVHYSLVLGNEIPRLAITLSYSDSEASLEFGRLPVWSQQSM
jgi:hypothetical protein